MSEASTVHVRSDKITEGEPSLDVELY